MSLRKKVRRKIWGFLGERFAYHRPEDVLLISLYLLEREEIKSEFTEDFVYGLCKIMRKDDIPMPEYARMSLHSLDAFNYISYKGGKMELTSRGKEKANEILVAITSSEEQEDIKKSLRLVKQLLS